MMIDMNFIKEHIPVPESKNIHEPSFKAGVLLALKALEKNSHLINVKSDIKDYYNKHFA